jgi:hypothetical protein
VAREEHVDRWECRRHPARERFVPW